MVPFKCRQNRLLIILTFILFGLLRPLPAQPDQTDLLQSVSEIKVITSDGVEMTKSSVAGRQGKALRLDFNFKSGAGYGGIRLPLPLELPENFRFTFLLKASSGKQNLEFKLIDASGDNVWWFNQRNYEFSEEWQKIIIKKRDIEFAWGPAADRTLRETAFVEIFIASVEGGSGYLELDELSFEVLPPVVSGAIDPLITASDPQSNPGKLSDGDPATGWRSANNSEQAIQFDLQAQRELGGMILDWDAHDFPVHYTLSASADGKTWDEIYRAGMSSGGRRYLRLNGAEARYLKLAMNGSSRNRGFALQEVQIKDFNFARTAEQLFFEIAKDQPRGFYPRYFYNEMTYWTITGAENDDLEILINEEGQVETGKSGFSVEPFIYTSGRLLTWNDSEHTQSLSGEYLPLPVVNRLAAGLNLEIQPFVVQEQTASTTGLSRLYIRYRLTNEAAENKSGRLFLALRPFQVNSPWQFLNTPGGVAAVKTIEIADDRFVVNGKTTVQPVADPGWSSAAASFDDGGILPYLARNSLPAGKSVTDQTGLASAAAAFDFNLASGQTQTFYLEISDRPEVSLSPEKIEERLNKVTSSWQDKLGRLTMEAPDSLKKMINVLRSNLGYILINRDGAGIQPGSRSYERSWIRDGSLTASALLRFGFREEARQFIDWFAGYQFENGKVPCVVDSRGPDPVPENDSHGQLIFAIRQYFQFTADTLFLEQHFENVRRAIHYMEELSASRRTETYRSGTALEQACFGLLPESISHEGYSAKPMHSYWDDFFALRGYNDAVEIARTLGREQEVVQWSAARDRFQSDLYHSLQAAINLHAISYLPGCAELGDFDATSTAVALFPAGQKENLPQAELDNTFNRYFQYFTERRDNKINWVDYTPYEVRTIGAFILLGQPERAWQLWKFFESDQRPAGWNHWAEVVRRGYRTTGFIGDMPHTWVGSDFINAVRMMFVYEDESQQALIIGNGIMANWFNEGERLMLKALPGYFGQIDLNVTREGRQLNYYIAGELKLPENGLWLRIPDGCRFTGSDAAGSIENNLFVRFNSVPVRVSFTLTD